MESGINLPSILQAENTKLHLTNIQVLAAIDCALAFTTLFFNVRQVILTIHEEFPAEDLQSYINNIDKNDPENSHTEIIVAVLASVCMTLTQLLLACLMMVSLSNRQREQERRVQNNTRLIAGVWASWSAILLIVLIVYAAGIKRFENFWDKFYLFMLIAEIILRVCIIFYTTLFFCCRCCYCRQ